MITEIKTIHCICDRCGYAWNPIEGKPPKVCPKCKSHKWNSGKKEKSLDR